ncbi:MAG: substrate-binding domain-containing protein [Treponema sp.]|nr:substrate-binding domain-containing protein [Candidatus Treponema equifaecale]
MSLTLILSIAFGVIVVFLLVSLIREKTRYSSTCKKINDELSEISGKVGKLSYGFLNQNLAPETDLPEEIQPQMLTLKKSFNKVTSEPLNRLCFVGTDAWFEGQTCAKHMGEKLSNGGKIAVVVTSTLEAVVMIQRYRAFVNTLKKEFPRIELVETFEAHADIEAATAYARKIAPTVDAIYVTGNSAVPGVSRGIVLAGRQQDVFIVCHDLDPAIVESMKSGIVSATCVCSPYGQGHDSLIHLFNNLNAGWKPYQPRLMQTLETVTPANLSKFWNNSAKAPRLDAFELEGKVKVMGAKDCPPRKIVVFCEDWNASCKQAVEGIKDAKAKLSEYNCEVNIYPLNQSKNPESVILAKAEEIIAKEMATGLDGICSFVGFTDFVYLLNRYAAQGITIASFNSEPLSLRSMIDWLIISSSQLNKFTGNYSQSLANVSESHKNIYTSLEAVAVRSDEQNDSILSGAESVVQMSEYIKNSAANEDKESAAVQQTAEVSRQLDQLAKVFDSKVQGLKTMGEQVKKSVAKTAAIQSYSEKIQSIIGMIDEISEQTNLLAFNAAVESSHAGEFGRGFKIISSEIRNLSDQSNKSTANISQLIDDMRKAVKEGINANNEMLVTVNDSVREIGQAANQLDELSRTLLSGIQLVKNAVTQNEETFIKMRSSASGLNTLMSESTKISQENTATINEINEEFGSMNEKIAEMQDQLKALAEMVTIMEGSVTSFSSN